LGTPLIIGPAALTTILILLDRHGASWTLASLLANLAVVWIVFAYAAIVSRFLGTAGLKALSKVISLFLAAIAIMMIRLGLSGIVGR
jgi:multiple antibiotic resistance protein